MFADLMNGIGYLVSGGAANFMTVDHYAWLPLEEKIAKARITDEKYWPALIEYAPDNERRALAAALKVIDL